MDLLNSILNSMDKPPGVNEQEKKLIKRQKELTERLKNKQKEELMRFRKYVEDRLERFSKDERHYIEYQPFDKVHRAVIHELSEFGGFIAMSFGREDIDRHTVVYKKEHAPSEDEVAARRNGDGWNEEVAEEYAERRRQQRELENEQRKARVANNKETKQPEQHQQQPKMPATSKTTENDAKPSSNYKDKYIHLIGQEAALDAARKTETNKSYGFVPSKNKKDMRSIEQTLADIQAKKRMRLQQEHEQQQLQQLEQVQLQQQLEQEQQQQLQQEQQQQFLEQEQELEPQQLFDEVLAADVLAVEPQVLAAEEQ